MLQIERVGSAKIKYLSNQMTATATVAVWLCLLHVSHRAWKVQDDSLGKA